MPFCTNCGEKVEDDQIVCSRCGESLENEKDKKRSEKDFFVPIDFSDVREAIPVGEDIIYSAFFMVDTYSVEPGVGPSFGSKTQHYTSHVLFTKNGIAYQAPKGGALASKYTPWYKIYQIHVGGFIYKKKMGTMFNFVHHYDSKYESTEEYMMRTWKFYFEFTPHAINEKKAHMHSVKKLEKSYSKLKKILGDEEIEFFRTNSDYEEFKKHFPVLQNAIDKTTPKWAKFMVRRFLKVPKA